MFDRNEMRQNVAAYFSSQFSDVLIAWMDCVVWDQIFDYFTCK